MCSGREFLIGPWVKTNSLLELRHCYPIRAARLLIVLVRQPPFPGCSLIDHHGPTYRKSAAHAYQIHLFVQLQVLAKVDGLPRRRNLGIENPVSPVRFCGPAHVAGKRPKISGSENQPRQAGHRAMIIYGL